MFDEKYFSKMEEFDDKYPDELNEDESRCSTPASAVTNEGSLESEPELLKQLNAEIDVTQGLLSGTNGLETYIQSKVKPMLEQIEAEAKKIVANCKDVADLRMSQQDQNILLHCPSLQGLLLKLGFSRNTEEPRDDLISCDRDCLLSEIEVLKADMDHAQRRHDNVVKGLHLSLLYAEKKNNDSQMVLQRSLGQSQEKLHSLEYKLKEYELEVAALQHSLMVSKAASQTLMNSLQTANVKILSLQQALKIDQNLKIDVMVTKENNQSLQEKLVFSDENVKSLRQNISDLEKEFRLYRRASEDKVKSLQQALKIDQNLKIDVMVTKDKNQFLQEKLVSSDENVKSLRQNISHLEKEFRLYQRASEDKVKSLQQALSSSKQKASSLLESLKMSEEKFVSLQNNYWALEEKLQSVQRNLSSFEGRARFLQSSLRTAEEKSKLLNESLCASEEKVQAMQKSSREKMEKIQVAVDMADAMHQKEVGHLQQMLNKTRQERDTMDSLYFQQLLKERDQYRGGVTPYSAASLPKRI